MISSRIQGAHATGFVADAARDRPSSQAGSSADASMRKAAQSFEAMFLAEMLSHAGLGETPEAFGGGFGEEAFADMLVREQARLMADRGGIGLAEHLFEAIAQRRRAE